VVQTFKDSKYDSRDGPVLVRLNQYRSAIAKRIRDIGNFNIHITHVFESLLDVYWSNFSIK